MFYKGPFNNYVGKIRGRGGQKMSVFVLAQGIKTVHAGGGGGVKKWQNSVHIVVECPLTTLPMITLNEQKLTWNSIIKLTLIASMAL